MELVEEVTAVLEWGGVVHKQEVETEREAARKTRKSLSIKRLGGGWNMIAFRQKSVWMDVWAALGRVIISTFGLWILLLF